MANAARPDLALQLHDHFADAIAIALRDSEGVVHALDRTRVSQHRTEPLRLARDRVKGGVRLVIGTAYIEERQFLPAHHVELDRDTLFGWDARQHDASAVAGCAQ